jgi:hypothetical protein
MLEIDAALVEKVVTEGDREFANKINLIEKKEQQDPDVTQLRFKIPASSLIHRIEQKITWDFLYADDPMYEVRVTKFNIFLPLRKPHGIIWRPSFESQWTISIDCSVWNQLTSTMLTQKHFPEKPSPASSFRYKDIFPDDGPAESDNAVLDRFFSKINTIAQRISPQGV